MDITLKSTFLSVAGGYSLHFYGWLRFGELMSLAIMSLERCHSAVQKATEGSGTLRASAAMPIRLLGRCTNTTREHPGLPIWSQVRCLVKR